MSDIKLRGGFGIREGWLAKAGDSTITHNHNFDHMTYVRGAATVQKLEPIAYDEHGAPKDFRVLRSVDKVRGGYVFIEADVWHRIIAREDNVGYHCLFVHRTPDGEISDEFDGWQAAYE